MAVETRGTVRLRGDPTPPTPVEVFAGSSRLRLTAAVGGVIGDWALSELGIESLIEGFSVRAEGEELILVTDDDPALAAELGIAAASPRPAPRIAAAHKPAERELQQQDRPRPHPGSAGAGPIFAVAGLLGVAGGLLLRAGSLSGGQGSGPLRGLQPGGRFWLLFMLLGFAMMVTGYLMTRGMRGARWPGVAGVVSLVVLTWAAVVSSEAPSRDALAYGALAAAVVAAVTALSLRVGRRAP